ncbi:type IV pilus modification protein PilV [Pseudomonadota bacterium]
MNKQTHYTKQKRQGGFTLIEAMVAILVLSLGLLGLAMLQAQGLKFNTTAYSRTQASMLAYEIIDKMRLSDPNGAAAYVMSSEPTATSCTALSITTLCAQQMWWESIIATLGAEATGAIANPGGVNWPDPSVFTVTINWVDRPVRIEYDPENPPDMADVAGINRNVTMSFEL